MKISKELKLGAFVVAVLVAAFLIINWLRGEDIFGREIDLHSSYDDVETLVVSNPVYIKGYKAGSVTDIDYNPKTNKFDVTCSVLKEFIIPKDSKMTIFSVDIMGGKGIDIVPGTSSELVSDGDYLEPASVPDMIGSLGESIGPLLSKVTTAVDSLSVTISGINALLSDSNKDNLSAMISHLDRTMANLERISASVSAKSPEIGNIVENLSSLSAKLGEVINTADGTLTTLSDLGNSIGPDLTKSVNSLKNVLDKVDDNEGTVGKLLLNDSVYDSLESLLKDLDNLITNIAENPKKKIKLSVF